MCLRYRRNAGGLDICSKNPHRIRCREEDAKAILYHPLHLPPDKPDNL